RLDQSFLKCVGHPPYGRRTCRTTQMNTSWSLRALMVLLFATYECAVRTRNSATPPTGTLFAVSFVYELQTPTNNSMGICVSDLLYSILCEHCWGTPRATEC